MSEAADLNQPNGLRALLVPLPRYGPVLCPDHRGRDCPACGGLRFVKVDVDALRVWPAKEEEA